ncbi:cAMP-binding domain of CRP or a regulatory subunit of cAMP-dependent protein kinases [Fervidobacterium changbaicum]|uniref:Crp/Fnr family transcriptional regulator n=2 Tax=Fervidobacterium TaxID=2422 RepID=A0AAI8CMD2_FERIS|nr:MULTISPECIES: Crp/Fnr family transcriptional regulator [Fervidobacterium]AMW33203.1 Crp/Fnr family transcriptional regulator [Fervidobacterium islandicum]SDH06531.1 cAMP-binding domain of CRP or a regulatory subunit of cAMP-dependent protein kinases [Fervidobacterium changbaicum]
MSSSNQRFIEALQTCEIFKGVEKSCIEEVVRNARVERYDSKELVRIRGDSCEELLFLVEGEAFGLFTNPEGRVLQIDHMFAPKLLAAAVIFSTDAKYPVDVETVKPSVFLSVEKDFFVSLLMKNEKLLRNYLQYVSDAFVFITDRFYEITMKNLVQKVCSYLVRLMDEQNSSTVTMYMSKEELAREFGATRPALSRVFIELERLGIIEMEGKRVAIRNERYVRDYAEFD